MKRDDTYSCVLRLSGALKTLERRSTAFAAFAAEIANLGAEAVEERFPLFEDSATWLAMSLKDAVEDVACAVETMKKTWAILKSEEETK